VEGPVRSYEELLRSYGELQDDLIRFERKWSRFYGQFRPPDEDVARVLGEDARMRRRSSGDVCNEKKEVAPWIIRREMRERAAVLKK
jgi:hypothetical protein